MAKPRLKERHIEVFRAVMATGSLTSAAQQLGVSQPSLSMTIRRFEDEIGARLFERISGRLVPTEEAKLILVEVERVYGQFELLSEAIHSIASGDASVFRFGTTPSIGMRLVPKALKRLKERHSARTFYCDFLSQKDIRDYLLFGQGSCVATIAEANDPTLETRVIARGKLVCLMPRMHRLARRASVSPEMLATETLISFAPETPHGRYIDATYARAGVARRTDVFVHFVEAAISFVCEDIGVSIIDQFSAMDCERTGLVAVPLEASVDIPAYVHWYRFRPRPRATDELIEALVEIAGTG
ncbi:MAG TPA: LysR family transcriptional regulator [Rhizobiaceae bacterium]|nr:LysR family transcriptional regulator [Rhizobiaceae bacterium]